MKKNKEKKSEKVINDAPVAAASMNEAGKVTAENHKQAAFHNKEAAKHHLEAAKHFEAGNHEKAAYSVLLANGHHAIAGQFISDDAKHHAQSLKHTNYRD